MKSITKSGLILFVILLSISCGDKKTDENPFKKGQPKKENLQYFELNEIKPGGWIRDILVQDIGAMVGHLDEMAPDLFGQDDIYGKDRITNSDKSKSVGSTTDIGEYAIEYLWWNSETQSNWRDGYIRTAFFLENTEHMASAKKYVEHILSTQDTDGYLGIYETDLRYNFTSENGELWSKATLLRGLLAYYEFTKEERVLTAVKRAVQNVMDNYKAYKSKPFKATEAFGGLCHGLVFTDILDRLYQYTGEEKYWNYALFLYQDYCNQNVTQSDVQYKNIIDKAYKLKCHGVHTYEHIRPLMVAAYASGSSELDTALHTYLDKIEKELTPSGGPAGDEWILEREAHASETGYEYCSIHELFDSYMRLVQKTANMEYAEKAERIYFNAAMGARHPANGSICYLKTDNSYEMTGTKNGKADPDTAQTRYKYSYVHQDNAVCCSPMAGRITPYYVHNMWMKGDNAVISVLFGASELRTRLNGKELTIRQETEFPESYVIKYIIDVKDPIKFALKIRFPKWAEDLSVKESYKTENGMIVIDKEWKGRSEIIVEFIPSVRQVLFKDEVYFTHGVNVLALPIEGMSHVSRTYAGKYPDYMYTPEKPTVLYEYKGDELEQLNDKSGFKTVFYDPGRKKMESKTLHPIGQTILRQVTFKKYRQ